MSTKETKKNLGMPTYLWIEQRCQFLPGVVFAGRFVTIIRLTARGQVVHVSS